MMKLNRNIFTKGFFLFICSLSMVHNLHAQIIIDGSLQLDKPNGNVEKYESISLKVDEPFDLSMLDYTSETHTELGKSTVLFGKVGNIDRGAHQDNNEKLECHEYSYDYTYNEQGALVEYIDDRCDSITQHFTITYKLDDQNRIIEATKIDTINDRDMIEEIAYHSNGKVHTISIITDSNKKFLNEYSFDTNNNLLSKKGYAGDINEYFYDDLGNITSEIRRRKWDAFVGEYLNYFYKDGVVEKIVFSELAGSNKQGSEELWPGKKRKITKMERENKGAYTIEKKIERWTDVKKGKITKTSWKVYDTNMNVILLYHADDKWLNLTKISYSDEN